MTDEEVAEGYMAVTSAGIDRPGTIAAKLKADHLEVRSLLMTRCMYQCECWWFCIGCGSGQWDGDDPSYAELVAFQHHAECPIEMLR